MSQQSHRIRSVTPSGPSGSGLPLDGEAREPDSPADTGFDPAAFEGPAPPPQAPGSDPFDPASLRLTQDFGAGLGVKKALLSVPVRKPDRAWWVRVHASEDYRIPTAVIELKGERGSETYLVAQPLWPELATEATFKRKLLATAINRQKTLFIWEVNLPRPDGRADEWSRTALEAVNMATAGWVRVTANMDAGAYDVYQATGQLPEPEWPDLPFRDLLRIAFKDRFIDSLDHPVPRRLRGEV
jgi:hypothetical protein